MRLAHAERRQSEILLVEDNAADVQLVRIAFADAADRVRLHVARDGEEALAFLRREGPHAAAPRPDLVLLDLNLPRLDGREVLQAVRGQRELRSIPIIVFTTSDSPGDVRAAYEAGANAYVAKPSDLTAFRDALRRLRAFWLELARLPAERGG